MAIQKKMIQESKEMIIGLFRDELGANEVELDEFSKLIDKNPEDWTCGLDELAETFMFEVRWEGDPENAMSQYIKFMEG